MATMEPIVVELGDRRVTCRAVADAVNRKGDTAVKKETGKAPRMKLRIHRETLRRLAIEHDFLKAVQGGFSAVNGTCHPSPAASVCALSNDGC
jgi:hypothetical protein